MNYSKNSLGTTIKLLLTTVLLIAGLIESKAQVGCIIEGAANYNPEATIYDGSCLVWDCYPSPYAESFSKSNFVSPQSEENQDRVTDELWITRGNGQGLFNAFSEENYDDAGEEGPEGTLWKAGSYESSDDPTDQSVYMSWRDHHNNNANELPGTTSTMYVVSEGLFFEIEWISWTCCQNGGGFSYVRSFMGGEDCTLVSPILGCTDSSNVNYNAEATLEDGSCIIEGCTNIIACNYDPEANTDDGSCTSTCPGCTNSIAANFDESATVDDGSCTAWDCYPLAYDIVFSKANSVDVFLAENQDRITDELWITRGNSEGLFNAFSENGFNSAGEEGPEGTLWKSGPYNASDDPSDESVYMSWADHHDYNAIQLPNTTSTMYVVSEGLFFEIEWLEWTCCQNGGGFSYNRTFVGGEDCTQVPAVLGCTDDLGANYSEEANLEDGSCIYEGCTDETACNYNPNVNTDDGSCTMVCPGCINSGASNYDENATEDDGSCTVWDCIPSPYSITFNKSNFADPLLEENQDRVTDELWISRGNNSGIFNVFSENSFNDAGENGPEGTLWKVGEYNSSDDPLDQSLYMTWRDHHNYNASQLPGTTSTMYVVSEGLFFEIEWLTWTCCQQGGGFSYIRTFVGGEDCIEIAAVLGCTDPSNVNFNVEANLDDGSCIYEGCIDEEACNYDPSANTDDGSCATDCFGCTSPDVANYDANATIDDGSCVAWDCYPAPYYLQFTRSDFAATFEAENQDRITDELWITRGSSEGIFNAFSQSNYGDLEVFGPEGTLWKSGGYEISDDPTDQSVYMSWEDHHNGNAISLPGTTSTLYVISEGLFFEIDWLTWTCCAEGGGFSYIRTFITGEGCAEIDGILGCTDPQGANFDENANLSNGSCIYEGCLDDAACNYDPNANTDDGSCTNSCPGCTNPNASNFDVNATVEDGSCDVWDCYPNPYSTAFSKSNFANSQLEENQDRVTSELWITRGNSEGLFNAFSESEYDEGGEDGPEGTLWKLGGYSISDDPTNSSIYMGWEDHHNSNAIDLPGTMSTMYVVDEGLFFEIEWLEWTCCGGGGGFSYIRTFVGGDNCTEEDAVFGCTDPFNVNYNPGATLEDGSCIYEGCTDEAACNFDVNANTSDDSCEYPDGNVVMTCPEDIVVLLQNNQISALVDFAAPTIQGVCPSLETTPQLVSGLSSGSLFSIGTITNTYELNYDGELYTCSFDISVNLVGCTDSEACNYNPNANIDNGNCTFDGDDLGISCADDIEIQLFPGNETISVNYAMPEVTGICDVEVILGENLFLDGGLLPGEQFPLGITPVNWSYDDGENSFSCGTSVNVLPYYGCTYPEADNYSPSAIENDGSCIFLDCDDRYTGATTVTFTKENFADWNEEENQDRITDEVWITRKNSQGIYNIFDQEGYSGGVGGPSNTEWYLGTTETSQPYDTWIAAALNSPAENCNNNSTMVLNIVDDGLVFDVIWHSFTGSNNGGGFSYTRTINAELSGCTSVLPLPGCLDETACNYNPDASIDNGTCLIAEENCLVCNEDNTALILVDTDEDGVCDAEELAGCTSLTACNYNPEATDSDDSCIEPVEDCSECNGDNTGLIIIDSDEDGVCDAEEVFGCTNPECTNFNPEATEDDGSCEDCIDSVSEIASSLMVNLYPNPVSDQLRIEIEGISSSRLNVVIRDILGREVVSLLRSNTGYACTETIDMKGQAQGLYFITIQTNEGQFDYKIIKD